MNTTSKNRLFETIAGLDGFVPEDFNFSLEKSTGLDTIQYRDSPLKFILQTHPADFSHFLISHTAYGPTYPQVNFSQYMGLNEMTVGFMRWIETNVKPYIENEQSPDLWEEYLKGGSVLNINFNNVNDDKFSLTERQGIIA